jgi:hypothetical protein
MPVASVTRIEFPPTNGPGRVFDFGGTIWQHFGPWTLESRYVLYDDHRFALQYRQPYGEYRGTYTEKDGVIVFQWEGWSIAGPWEARGFLNGDSLQVRYNEIMHLTDFDDADYLLETTAGSSSAASRR